MESLSAAAASARAAARRLRLAVLTIEAGATLAGFRLALLLLPWRRVMALGGSIAAATASSVPLRSIENAVRRASRVVPGATCLAQALALRRLLLHYGHPATLHIGVTTADGRFSAHAWVESDGAPLLCSAGEVGRYALLASWPPASSPTSR